MGVQLTKSTRLSLSIIVIYFDFFLCFRYDASTELGASVLRVVSGPRVKLRGCESA